MRKLRLYAALLLGLTFCLPALGRADLIFTLDQPVQSVLRGATVTYTGSLTNLNGPTLFLNGDSFTLDGPGLTLDDTLFLLSAPVSLDSGDSYTGTFFTVTADLSAPFQQSVGRFNILGGATDTGQSLLASREFQTNVVVPEPGSLTLIGSLGVMGAAPALLRRKRRQQQALITARKR